MKPRLLFIVKFRERYDGSCGYDGTPSCFGGLYHSALFVVQMLRAAGVSAKLVQVCDNNQIDREVAAYKPTDVIIEALWVVPEKFTILHKLHPSVRWIVRIHSEMPFLANEGIAIDWITRYVQHAKVFVASNSQYATHDLQAVVAPYQHKILYLPNFYPTEPQEHKKPNHVIDIGCFGAIRPLKNQLIQVLAAIEYARGIRKHLRLHINTRCEQGGDAVLKNIRAMVAFAGATLVEHKWEMREDFLESLARTDIGMQVSFSETFDITAADTVSLGIPLVTSKEVVWATPECQADTTNAANILSKLRLVTGIASTVIKKKNLARLRAYCAESRQVWLHFATA